MFDERTHDTACPEVGAGVVEVSRYCDVSGGARIFRAVNFEADLRWVRESESRVLVLDADGRAVHEGSTHIDWYGLLTSPRDCLGAAPGVARRFGARADGPLEVVVSVDCFDTPYLPSGKDPVFRGRRSYRPIPRDATWHLRDDGRMAAWIESMKHGFGDPKLMPPMLGPRAVAVKYVLWTSRDEGRTAAERLARVDGLAAAVAVGLPPEEGDKLRERAAALSDIVAAHGREG
jgi:hypothetical protein